MAKQSASADLGLFSLIRQDDDPASRQVRLEGVGIPVPPSVSGPELEQDLLLNRSRAVAPSTAG
jgi:hypothetical protein